MDKVFAGVALIAVGILAAATVAAAAPTPDPSPIHTMSNSLKTSAASGQQLARIANALETLAAKECK